MRTGYNLAISSAVAAVSLAGFAAAAQFGHQHQPSSGQQGRHPHWKKENIVRLGPVAKHGLFAEGIETGSGESATWKIRVDARSNQVRAQVTGGGPWYVGNLERSVNPGSIGTFYYSGIQGWPGVYGVVSKNVTRVAVTMNNHQTLNLYPVAAAGRRWIGLLMPLSARAMSFTAYSGKTELARAVSTGALPPVSWLRPGQKGPASQYTFIAKARVPSGSGHHLRWNSAVQAGPTGYCVALIVSLASRQGFLSENCMSPDTAQSAGVKEIVSRPFARWLLGTARPSVAYLKFDLAKGKALRAPAVLVSGQRFFGLALLPRQNVTNWAAYDKAGHRLYGGTGQPKVDRYTGPLAAAGWAANNTCALSSKACPRAHG